jgi:hypothetical protein
MRRSFLSGLRPHQLLNAFNFHLNQFGSHSTPTPLSRSALFLSLVQQKFRHTTPDCKPNPLTTQLDGYSLDGFCRNGTYSISDLRYQLT